MYCTCSWNGWQHAVKPDIGSESQFLPTLPAFNAAVRRGGGVRVTSKYCHAVWYGKTRIAYQHDCEKFWRYVYSFWQNVQTWQTHTQTDRHHMMAKAVLDASIARHSANAVTTLQHILNYSRCPWRLPPNIFTFLESSIHKQHLPRRYASRLKR